MTNDANANLTHTLSDGRRLGFALFGDEGGTPLCFFHGWPGSRLRAKIYAEIARRLQIRIIAPDRPGIGLSDPKPQRTILDWPGDLVQLMDHLCVERFAVLGVSGGGVYAAVCGHVLAKQITNVGIAAAPAPLDAPHVLDGLQSLYKLGWQGYARYRLVAYASSFLHAMCARYLPKLLRSTYRSTADRQIYERYGGELLAAKQECFQQGFCAAAHDVVIGTRAWGFDVSEIDANVYLWYGGLDPAISLGIGEYLASQIIGSKLTIYPADGHLLSIVHAEEILATLASPPLAE